MGLAEDAETVVVSTLRYAGALTGDQLDQARRYQQEYGGLLGDVLLRLELVKEAEFLRIFAEHYGTRFLKSERLRSVKIDDRLVEAVGSRMAERLRMCPIRIDAAKGEFNVIVSIPMAPDLEKELKAWPGVRSLNVYLATPGVVAALVRKTFYNEQSALAAVTPNGAGPGFPPRSHDTLAPVVSTTALLETHADEGESDEEEDAAPQRKPEGTVVVRLSDVEKPKDSSSIDALRKENARYRIAQEFHRLVTLERSFEAMVDRILQVIFELLPAEGAAIWLTTGEVKTRKRSGEGDLVVPRAVIDQTLKADSVVLVNDALIDRRFDRSESVVLRGIQSVMSTPLRTREGTLGILYVESTSMTAAFHQEDLPLLDSIGAQASLLLDNAILINRVQQEVENRVHLSRFLSPAAVEEVLSGRMKLNMAGQSADITVLFADLRGFTTLSANMHPEEVVTFLNAFFKECVEAVERNNGVIDKFIGDCVMATWGAPVERERDARDALKAAQEIIASASRILVNGNPIQVGVGVNSGPAIVGAIGTKERSDYTAIGSMVNVASRMCSIANVGEVLMTSDTLMRAGVGVVAEARESVMLKGLSVPVVPYVLKSLAMPLQLRTTSRETRVTESSGTPAVSRDEA